jgi:hypothetical protein
MQQPSQIKPIKGKLGILLPGMGAVAWPSPWAHSRRWARFAWASAPTVAPR